MNLPHHDIAIVGSGFAGLFRRELRRIEDGEFTFQTPRAPVPAASTAAPAEA